MDGLGYLLKAAGIDFNPEEIKQAVETAKVLIPKIAEQFEAMQKRLNSLEEIVLRIENKLNIANAAIAYSCGDFKSNNPKTVTENPCLTALYAKAEQITDKPFMDKIQTLL